MPAPQSQRLELGFCSFDKDLIWALEVGFGLLVRSRVGFGGVDGGGG